MFLTTGLILIQPTLNGPSEAATNAPLFSLDNTNFVVSIAFVAFIAILIYLRVPSKIANLLDKREESIREEIDSATAVLEESKTLLADLEREHKSNIVKAGQIIIEAEAEAKRLLVESKKEIRLAIERKIKLAEDQIKATENAVLKSIKDRAIDQGFLLAENQLTEIHQSESNKSNMNDSLESLNDSLKKLHQ
jgi:F-type H+-transporting ATPase subunit b